jgi:hypothetical protein
MRSVDRRIRRLDSVVPKRVGNRLTTRGSAALSLLTIALEPLPKCFARRTSGGGKTDSMNTAMRRSRGNENSGQTDRAA